jgi:hypothetical protein
MNRLWTPGGTMKEVNRTQRRFVTPLLWFVILSSVIATAANVSAFPTAAAIISESTRQPQYNDFLRLIYANLPAPPTTLGGPNAYRVFFGATTFYQPPIQVGQIANFSGIPVDPTKDLYVLRCIPPSNSEADPTLAVWAQVIKRIQDDYETHPPAPNTTDEAIQSIAQNFVDIESQVVDLALSHALNTAVQFFEEYPAGSSSPIFSAADMQKQMSTRFGTFTAFTGLGYAAEGTATSPALDSDGTSRAMVIPDFILKNVTLGEAGCRCIQVPSTVPNRDSSKLDPNFVWRFGGDGFCRKIRFLGAGL